MEAITDGHVHLPHLNGVGIKNSRDLELVVLLQLQLRYLAATRASSEVVKAEKKNCISCLYDSVCAF